jgi:hypothetical protein
MRIDGGTERELARIPRNHSGHVRTVNVATSSSSRRRNAASGDPAWLALFVDIFGPICYSPRDDRRVGAMTTRQMYGSLDRSVLVDPNSTVNV